MQGKALWYVGPGQAELREETVAAPQSGEAQVRSLFGAISRGTERLVHAGRVPASEYGRMRAPLMSGAFPFPVKYGYATVGRVEAGPAELRGRVVFSLHPHQSLFTLPADAVFPLPEGVTPSVPCSPPIWKPRSMRSGTARPARPIASPSWAAGWLACWWHICAPGCRRAQVTVVDVAPTRAELAHAIGARFAAPDEAPADCDLVFHASGTAAGLATALRLAGEEATIVELSWYGSGDIAVPFGEAFHSRRLRLISSQVGKVAPSHRARWTHGRRLAAALALLDAPVLDVLLRARGRRSKTCRRSCRRSSRPSPAAVCPLIRYPAAGDETH